MSCGATLIRKLCENMESGMLASRVNAAAGLWSRLGCSHRFVQRQNAVSTRSRSECDKSPIFRRTWSTLAASADSYQETQACIEVNSSDRLAVPSVPVQEEATLVSETKVRKRKIRSSATKKGIISELEVASEAAVVVEEVLVSSSTGAGSSTTSTDGTGAGTPTKVEKENATFIVFDIETTGFRPADDRIIEFAARDLAGGENSTVCALVNPGRQVPYFISAITGISNAMVNRPDIPSWKEVGPVIVRFVESRRQGNGPIVLVAHNGKRFDVPFLLKEFLDCSIEIPKDWRFLDSMPLAREAKKKCGYDWPSLKLGDIHKAYGLKKSGRAHRAMADVHMLAPVVGLMIWDLRMQLAEILQRSFTADDIVSGSKLFQSQAEAAEEADEEILAKEEGFEVPWEEPVEQATSSYVKADEEEKAILDTVEEESEVSVLPELELSSSIDTTSVDIEQLDPVLKQYVGMKRSMPDFVHFLRSGDQYEAFFEDAETFSRVCKARLILTDDGKIEVPVVRLSVTKANGAVRLLLSKGLNVVKQNQFEGGEIDAILTPGMILDDGLSEETGNNHLAALVVSPTSENWGLAFCDVSSGELFATQGDTLESMKQAVTSAEPAELILPSNTAAVCIPSNGFGITRLFPDSYFSPLTSETGLLLAAGSEVLDPLRNCAAADCACGALLRYIQKTQGISIEDLPFRRLYLYSVKQYLQMDPGVRSYLQLLRGLSGGEGSLVWAVDSTKTSMGSRMLKKWISQPLVTMEDIIIRQEAVQVLIENASIRAMLRFHLSSFADIGRLVGNIVRKKPVAWEDLLAVADSLSMLPELSCLLEGFPDNQYFSSVTKTPSVLTELAEEIQGMLSADSYKVSAKELVRDGMDEVLDTLRAEARDCRKFLEDFMEAQSQVANGNRSDARMEYERRKLEALNKSFEREQQLLEACKNKIVTLLEVLQATNECLAALDVLSSLAEVAATRDYCRPELLPDGGGLSVVDGRHPVREVMGEFIPNSCHLGHQSSSPEEVCPRPNVILLNGSPGSGKSSYLQQMGLIQVLAQCGSFVPAKEARLSVADAVYFIGPDTEPSAAAAVLQKATSRSLVLVDEFRASADSQEAETAITKAIVEYLAKEVKAKCIFGTRDHSLRFQQDELPYIAGFHISSKEHRLSPGTWYEIDGLELARRGGFPDWVCTRAGELLDSGTGCFHLLVVSCVRCRVPFEGKELLSSPRTTGSSSNSSTKHDPSNNAGPSLSTGMTETRPSEPIEDLDALWKQVSALLQNTPATLALAQQKGSLRSVSRDSQSFVATIGTAPMFVKKFTQHEHAAALEAAFESILNHPVKLRVELLDQ